MPDQSDQRISFTCPECKAHLKVPAKLASVTGPCPKCHASITAPDTSAEQASENESEHVDQNTSQAPIYPSSESSEDPSEREAEESGEDPSYRILPAPVYDVSPRPSFPPPVEPITQADSVAALSNPHGLESLSSTTHTPSEDEEEALTVEKFISQVKADTESESESESAKTNEAFQPFFLPGKAAPVLNPITHADPIRPDSNPVFPAPSSEKETDTGGLASTPQLLSNIADGKNLKTETSPSAFVFPNTETPGNDEAPSGLKLPPIPHTSASTEKTAEDPLPSPQDSRNSFAPLFKGLTLIALLVFISISMLVGDYFLGDINFLHKLPGFTPASTFVSAILTPPNLQTSDTEKNKDSDDDAKIDPDEDTIAKADLESPIENGNTIVKVTDNSSLPFTPIKLPPLTISSPEPLDEETNPAAVKNAAALPEQTESAEKPASPTPPDESKTKGLTISADPRLAPDPSMIEAASTTNDAPFIIDTPPAIIINDASPDSDKMATAFSGAPSISDSPKAEASASPSTVRAKPIKFVKSEPKNDPLGSGDQSEAPKAAITPPSPQAMPLASSTSGKLLSEPRQVAEAFLHAVTLKERLPYIYNGKKLEKSVTDYYQKDPQGAISDYTLEFINMERSRADNTLFYVFFLVTKELPDGFPIILRSEDGQIKVDWEIFAEFNDQHFKHFTKGEDQGPHPLRIMLKRASYWGPDKDKFTDLNDYLCFGVSAPPFPEDGEFVFIKKDAPLAAHLEKELTWGQRPVSGIVELEKVKFAHGQTHLLIKNIITDGWFSPSEE